MYYDLICQLEEAAFMRRFLPYSIGTPKTTPTFYSESGDDYPRANLLFFSDSHLDFKNPEESTDNVRRIVSFANRSPVRFDALVHAGDIMTIAGIREKEEAKKRAEKFFSIMKESKSPVLFAKGNHDLNDWKNLPQNVLTDRDWGELFLDYAEQTYGICRQKKQSGDDSTWHYFDLEDHKIRIITVDIQDTDKTVLSESGVCKFYGGTSWYISHEQMNWIVSTALNFDQKPEKDWGVIFNLHQVMDAPALHANATDALLGVCTALNQHGTYTYRYTHPEYSFFDMDVQADFTRYAKEEKKPHIICWLLGHDHVRKQETLQGIHLIWTLNSSATSAYGDPRVPRIPGTCTQNSFDVVNIDTRHRRIRLFAYGAGTTCYGIPGDRFLPEGLPY